jgi:hypothetical protein
MKRTPSSSLNSVTQWAKKSSGSNNPDKHMSMSMSGNYLVAHYSSIQTDITMGTKAFNAPIIRPMRLIEGSNIGPKMLPFRDNRQKFSWFWGKITFYLMGMLQIVKFMSWCQSLYSLEIHRTTQTLQTSCLASTKFHSKNSFLP